MYKPRRRLSRKGRRFSFAGERVLGFQEMDQVYLELKRRKLEEQGIKAGDVELGSANGVKEGIHEEPSHSDLDKQFLLAVERGDLASVKLFLKLSQDGAGPKVNINCKDPLGRSALLVAIEYENIEMIEVLLAFGIEVGDALLHAINEENVEAVERLLRHQAGISYFENPGQPIQSDSFTPDITPLMLASHRDNYEIIKILLERGDRIPKPHLVQCPCKECLALSADDILCHSRSRINTYKALSSPSLICLSSRDPILTAFELSWELNMLSNLEPEFRTAYTKLSKLVSLFATELLDQTRGSEELEVILNHDTESPVTDTNQERMTLSRLKLAIKYKQKEFVAHPHCQQLLASIWYEGLPGFRRRHIGYKLLMTVLIGLLAPLWSLLYMFAPKSRFGSLMRKPFIKFIVHSASYCMFLFLLILTSQRIELVDPGIENRTKNEQRGLPPTKVEWLILSYVLGLIWSEMKQLWDLGFKEYIHDMWNLLDFTTNAIYLATLTLRVIAFLKVEEEKKAGLPSALIARSDWNTYDPNLIAEALFSIANIFSTLKLVYIFSINPYLGPLQISLGRMIGDFVKWAVIIVLVLFSFACGLNQLLWYYSFSTSQKCRGTGVDDLTLTTVCSSKFYKYFADLFQIVQTLYWAMYGLVDLDSITLVADHKFTEFIGRTMFGVYTFITVIVLLNMLIAMMNNSYQIIYNQADSEWKFARSKLWMNYFEEGGTVPSPFNVIPTPKSLWYLLVAFKNLMCCCSKKLKNNQWQSLRKIVKKINDREQSYQVVMRNLIKRYIMNKSRDRIEEGVTEDDINEIKQDVSAFRYELLEILRNNGMVVNTNNLHGGQTGNSVRMKKKRSHMKQWQKLVTNIEETRQQKVDDVENLLNRKAPVREVKSETLPAKIRNKPVALTRSKSAFSFDTASPDNDTSNAQRGYLKSFFAGRDKSRQSGLALSTSSLSTQGGMDSRSISPATSDPAFKNLSIRKGEGSRQIFTLNEENHDE